MRLERIHERHTLCRRDDGDTLVEVLLALVVIGLTVVSILGAFGTTLSATVEHRTEATNDTVLRTLVEDVTFDLRLDSPPQFVACATTNQAQYSTFASNFQNSNPGYQISLTVTAFEGPGCQSSPSSPPPNPLPTEAPAELLTAMVTHSGASDSLQFVVMDPDATGTGSLSSDTYTINPAFGPAAGGTSITISAGTGLSFTGATSVNFVPIGGGSPTNVSLCSHPAVEPCFTVNPSGSTVSLESPAETLNNFEVYVSVTIPSGTTTPSAGDLFTYGPSITAPLGNPTGPVTGQTSVTIIGNGFTATSTVLFGSTPATAVTYSGSSTSLQALSPPGVGVVDVTVTTAGQTSPITQPDDEFTYGLAVTSVSPDTGPTSGTNSVVINGSGFANVTAVHFGTTLLAASDYTVDPSQTFITVSSVPAGSGTVDVTVTVSGGITSPISQPADQYTYASDEPAGIAIVMKANGSTGTPLISCSTGSGNGNCSSAQSSGTCAITGASSYPTNPVCAISGLQQNGSTTLYVELVDSSGKPVAFSPGASSSITLTNACATSSPKNMCVTSMSIASGSTITTDTVTASYQGNQGATADISLTTPGNTTFALTLKISQ